MAARKKATSRRDDKEMPKRRDCGTMRNHERLMREVPDYIECRQKCEEHAWRAAMSPMVARTGCTKIPVVVHVVHRNDTENISKEQIDSQIKVLNDDFRLKNADASSIPEPFKPFAEDARIQFELASKDPRGNATDGVTRKRTNVNGFGTNDDVKSSATGGVDPWPTDRYLNIWVCRLSGGLLGYAQFPGGPADTDGVVVTHTGFGTTGTAAAPFDLGRTTVHEIGHWLNLFHIWGDDGSACFGSDNVADTPNQAGPNTGTPTFPSVSCNNGPNGDMFMNYMDYTNDAGMFMFTKGQVARMQAALDGPRSSIGSNVPCGKQIWKELPKDPGDEVIKPIFKDHIKDPIKETAKDHAKDPFKDPIKEFHKEWPKEFHKDPPKDPPKDRPKEWPKEWPFDPGPKGLDPGPKLRDPGPKIDPGPKGFDPGPKNFDPGPKLDPGPFPSPFPGLDPGAMRGATPFVLATGAGGPCNCQETEQQNAALQAQLQQMAAQLQQLQAAHQQLAAQYQGHAGGVQPW